MKHIKLFEAFGQMGRVATCFQGDAYAAVGILNESQERELQEALDAVVLEFPELSEYLSISKLDVSGMEYVSQDANGEFVAMPAGTDPLEYAFHVKGDGTVEDGDDYDTSRLFDLVDGKMLFIDHHGSADLLTVGEFIRKYITGI